MVQSYYFTTKFKSLYNQPSGYMGKSTITSASKSARSYQSGTDPRTISAPKPSASGERAHTAPSLLCPAKSKGAICEIRPFSFLYYPIAILISHLIV